MPPEWSGDASSSHLWLLDGIDGSVQGVDSIWLHSKSAFAYDIDSGEVLIAKSPDDDRLPVASLTKLISGLTVSAESSQLDAPLCLDEAIQQLARCHDPLGNGSVHTGLGFARRSCGSQ